MSRESATSRRLEPAPVKTNPTGDRANHTALAVRLIAVPLFLADWFMVGSILAGQCVSLYKGGNITDCAGLSEEQAEWTSGLVALVLLAIQLWLIVLVSRRVRSGPRRRRSSEGLADAHCLDASDEVRDDHGEPTDAHALLRRFSQVTDAMFAGRTLVRVASRRRDQHEAGH